MTGQGLHGVMRKGPRGRGMRWARVGNMTVRRGGGKEWERGATGKKKGEWQREGMGVGINREEGKESEGERRGRKGGGIRGGGRGQLATLII